jgi:dCTP deaminase
VQVALTKLTETHFPERLGHAVCLVRPQWKYNLTYVPLTHLLKDIISVSVLDPEGKLQSANTDELLAALWKRWVSRVPDEEREPLGETPRQLAVLSFAGLDTQDVLLYPLLAHELGHFIDYSHDPPLHLQPSLRTTSEIKAEQVSAVYAKVGQKPLDERGLNSVLSSLIQRCFVCLRELLADLIAVRMLGLSFFIAQSEFLKALAGWPGQTIEPSGYPGIAFRLSVVFRHLTSDVGGESISKSLRGFSAKGFKEAALLTDYMEKWEKQLEEAAHAKPMNEERGQNASLDRLLSRLVEQAVRGSLSNLEETARAVVPDQLRASLSPKFFERIARLRSELPPVCIAEDRHCFAEIMSASWAYQLFYGREIEAKKKDAEGQSSEYDKTCRLILKALELIQVSKETSKGANLGPAHCAQRGVGTAEASQGEGGVLNSTHIRRRMFCSFEEPNHLSVTPLNESAIQTSSLDIHLGNWFSVARRVRLPSLELGKDSEERIFASVGKEEHFVPMGQRFIIHPGDLVLGASLEFLALPSDLMAFVDGRSTLGRRGLIVATAGQVAPGFHGVIILELANAGTIPLALTPGISVAQLVFQTVTERCRPEELYRGKFYCQIKP